MGREEEVGEEVDGKEKQPLIRRACRWAPKACAQRTCGLR